jgi:hypothetical protein
VSADVKSLRAVQNTVWVIIDGRRGVAVRETRMVLRTFASSQVLS